VIRPLESVAALAAPRGRRTAAAEIADRRAVAMARAGHPEAFEELVRRHEGSLLSLCSRLLRDRRLGEELTQETFARAFSGLETFRGRCSFRHWLYRIAANGCRDFLRAGERSERPSAFSGEELWTIQDPEREAVAHQSFEALVEAVSALPPRCRQAFVLFHLENFSYQEMSEATGVAVNALKVRVHRARLLLRRRLGGVLEPPRQLAR
jgi:RNA polymerase sigma-70 factor, ECF subfamily